MLSLRSSALREESGQITILLVVFSAIAMGFVMVAVDASLVFLGRQRLASAVDAAAVRAAQQFDQGKYFEGACTSSVPLDEDQINAVLASYEQHGVLLGPAQIVDVDGGPGVRVTGTLAVALPDIPVIGMNTYTVTYHTEARTKISGAAC
ncbi:MAG: pilus assembly protein TadG-related protein [Mycobacteriales bacterium]